LDVAAAEVVGQPDAPLEAAVGDLHALVGAAFLEAEVASYAAHGEESARQFQLDVLRPDAGEVELDEPPVAGAVDVGGWLPHALAARVGAGGKEGLHEANQITAHGSAPRERFTHGRERMERFSPFVDQRGTCQRQRQLANDLPG